MINHSWGLSLYNSGGVCSLLIVLNGTSMSSPFVASSASALPLGWVHVAWLISGLNGTLFTNGVPQQFPLTTSATYWQHQGANTAWVGQNSSGVSDLTATISQLRCTQGFAYNPDGFTPPANIQPLPNDVLYLGSNYQDPSPRGIGGRTWSHNASISLGRRS